jgi:hypothetical protein
MFINALHLVAILAAQCPETIMEVGDYYIIENIQYPFAEQKDADSRIAYLPPPENKVETHEYPYVKTVKPSVHIARAHVKQDFKS